jgi:hypothetical protein
MDLPTMRLLCEDVEWIELIQNKERIGFYDHSYESLTSVNGGRLLTG